MKLGITMLIHKKDDIEFVTELPCFLRHPVVLMCELNRSILDILGLWESRSILDILELWESKSILDILGLWESRSSLIF